MPKMVKFYAESGTRLSCYEPPDGRLCEYVFGEAGHLSFTEDDQEPIRHLRASGFAETPPKPATKE